MLKTGRVAFNKMDAVTFGVPAADALKEEVARIGGQRIFLMISGSLNRNTDEISKIRNLVGLEPDWNRTGTGLEPDWNLPNLANKMR